MAKKVETFEGMINRLEEIVEKMDNGELSLEESMKDYEEGIKLCNKLYKQLKDAEGKIKILREGKEEEFLES